LTILSLPTFSRTAPSFQTFSLMPNTASFTSPLNGAVQTSELPGARWVSTFGWNGLTDLDVRILKAWLNKLSGRAGRFYLTDYTHKTPSGTAQGSPVVNGASQTGRTLVTSGWTPNQTALLLPGDYFSVGSQLCVITETASADGSGNATLTFEPPLRLSPSNALTVVTASPKCIMMLEDDKQDNFPFQEKNNSSVSIKCLEMF